MTYMLRNGYSVRTAKIGEATEFVTLNPKGETISSVTLSRSEARELLLALRKGKA